MKSITPTREDYVRAIYCLKEQGENVRSVDVVTYLHLARSTVSERLRDLERAQLIKTDRTKGIVLTKKGIRIAEKLTYKHRLIEVFLHKVLSVDSSKVHEEAHKLEHVFSDEVIAKLAQFLGNPKEDPHGKKIKKA